MSVFPWPGNGGALSVTVEIIDNSQQVKGDFRAAVLRALERCGLQAEGYAVDLAPVAAYQGGTLRDSITHKVVPDEDTVYIGSNAKYAVYVEMGTGKYVAGGRPTPWVYQDALGNWHLTHGQPPQPYLKPAVVDHVQTYKNIIEDEMKNG